jgi:hypothetical protein
MRREEWLAHYAKLRAYRNSRPWYTGIVGRIYGCSVVWS